MDVPRADKGWSPLVTSPVAGPVISAATYSLPLTSAPVPHFPAFSVAAGVEPVRFVDPEVAANLEELMREAKGLPIGSVRAHAVAHLKVDYFRGSYFLNGKSASLEELRTEFARLGRIGGAVLYYKEGSPTEKLPPEAEVALAAICEARLPVTFAARDYDPAVKIAEYFLPKGTW
jgi:hypothetical protein